MAVSGWESIGFSVLGQHPVNGGHGDSSGFQLIEINSVFKLENKWSNALGAFGHMRKRNDEQIGITMIGPLSLVHP